MSDAAVALSAAEATRRRLTVRQAAAVAELVEAATAEARERGYDGLTVRSVARRAGVAPATAYTYFASKDHLLAEVLWRRLEALPRPDTTAGADTTTRLVAELRVMGLFMADDPTVAAACTTALLRSGPEVRELRVRVGAAMHDRLVRALGDGADPHVVATLDLVYSGAMLWGGLGHMAFADVPDALEDAARVIVGGHR